MTRRLFALLMTAVVAAGCSAGTDDAAPRGPQTTTIAISYDDLMNQKNISRTITLAMGDTLQISLGSNPSTGYQWDSDMRISDDAVLVQAGHEVLAASNARPGAPGSAVWALQAVGRGRTTVTTSYGRPWEGGEKNTWTFTADVTVN